MRRFFAAIDSSAVDNLGVAADAVILVDDGTLNDGVFSDAHWRLTGDGRWTRVNFDDGGEPLGDLQTAMIDMHAKRRRKARRR